MNNLAQDSKHVCLVGDFNARTGHLPDFFKPDAFLSQVSVHICDEFSYSETRVRSVVFEKLSIPLQRTVQDVTVYNFGNKFTEFCKNIDLYIVNSRLGSDKNIGAVTCRNRSTVDYVIASVNIFEVLQDFDIHYFCNLYSDVHKPVCLQFHVLIISLIAGMKPILRVSQT